MTSDEKIQWDAAVELAKKRGVMSWRCIVAADALLRTQAEKIEALSRQVDDLPKPISEDADKSEQIAELKAEIQRLKMLLLATVEKSTTKGFNGALPDETLWEVEKIRGERT